jgi:hypothetical protein
VAIYDSVNQQYVSIQDLDPEKFELMENADDICAILNLIKYRGKPTDFPCILVEFGNKGNTAVWGVENYVPQMCSKVRLLWSK